MSDSESGKRGKVKSFLKAGLSKGITKGKEGLTKGKLHLQHAIGLGHQPNVVPPGEPGFSDERRTVAIGWHPVPGAAWLTRTSLGKLIRDKINKYPDPTQHWAILVGDYCHQLWMDENLDVIYINGRLDDSVWTTYEVGHTKLNDQALREAGEMTIHYMREKQKGYNLITNNCQNFALNMLDAIQVGKHKQFGTTMAIYKRATGKGAVSDLFIEQSPQAEEQDDVSTEQIVSHASKVMDENTTILDARDEAPKLPPRRYLDARSC
ncbi:hypothetical protein F5Y18DRAFT_403079 [Xylariaceae sp. FL1019]|nr:hypothetical protein F5Y18DRAFT_403079 [Xylariaceae sp. FL1019]